MRINKYLTAAIVAVLVYTLPGCAFIFTPGKQKVTVHSTTPGATIKYKNDSVGTTKTRIKLRKNEVFQSITLEKEGFKSKNYCFELAHISPWYAISVLDMALYFGPLWERKLPKLKKFAPVQDIPEMTKAENRKNDEKYLLVNNVAADIKAKDINFKSYGSIKSYQKKAKDFYVAKEPKAKKKKSLKDDLKIENTIYADELNYTLKKMNFIDTTRTIFPNVGNSLFLNATIKKITFYEIFPSKYFGSIRRQERFLSAEMEIEWDLLDYYKQKVFTTKTTNRSDLFLIKYNFAGDTKAQANEAILRAIRDNMEYSLIELRAELSRKNLITIGTGGSQAIDTEAVIAIKTPATTTNGRINDFLKSSVSIKVDEGHGSGVIASEDGYIITNYHVIANSTKIEVIFNDGSKAIAEVVRKNANADLALLKVKKDSLMPLMFSNAKDPDIGVDVWAIGTPKSLELGQSVSKGIISGVRKANGVTYLQTDVKISPGNSGGALINKDGVVLGIISSKLIGFGTEGVGFAIISAEVLEKLKLQYK